MCDNLYKNEFNRCYNNCNRKEYQNKTSDVIVLIRDDWFSNMSFRDSDINHEFNYNISKILIGLIKTS